jgi:hypothetical protein
MYRAGWIHTAVTLQKVCLIALGRLFLGFAVSAAPKPTISVPLKAKAAVTNTEQRPLKPSLKAPGLWKYFPPMYPPWGPPPQSKTIPKMLDPY